MLFSDLYFMGDEEFEVNFIRLGSDVYITEPGDVTTPHSILAEQSKITEKIEQMREGKVDEIDAGLMFVSGKSIRIASLSENLNLPEVSSARKLTIERMSRKFNDFQIKELIEN